MAIICFEGASAVGKTTTARAIEETCGAFIVPEVNQLFARPENEPPEWYFERQLDRWQIAGKEIKNYELVILDGDPFQPLWYNWAYDYAGWQKLDFMEEFYGAAIQNKMIDFPRLYFILSTNEAELRKRKMSDSSRQRHGFETHLKMIAPQRRYFEAVKTFSPGKVVFLEAETIESNIEFIRDRALTAESDNSARSELLFGKITQWLRENRA